MAREISSKNFDGITDLVVIAPIKKGFINAYENITYATRLKVVAEALNKIRVAAREFEETTPFSDVTERILTLLDFRIGVLDYDLFSLPTQNKQRGEKDPAYTLGASDTEDQADKGLTSQRYLYLTATFDGAWEPYMRLIWDPLGPFLDLLFCNCEGYVTAGDHSFDEYAQWVRDNQMDSAIFYATTGLTVRDHLYLNRLEQIQRKVVASPATDLELARLTMPNPEIASAFERRRALVDASQNNFVRYKKIHELALEALTVLYRLADFYPPEWLIGPLALPDGEALEEGKYLARVAHSVLMGWESMIPTTGPLLQNWNDNIVPVYGHILNWHQKGKIYLETLKKKAVAKAPKDPKFVLGEVQGGILKAQGSQAQPIRLGALMLVSITDAQKARRFVEGLDIHFETEPGAKTFMTLGFTPHGLRRIGLEPDVLDHFPKEFREGMEVRSGLLGDMRENHPRNWILPKRNWPPLMADATNFAIARPPVEFAEVDIILQVRTTEADEASLHKIIKTIADTKDGGVRVVSIECMATNFVGPNSEFVDHFGFRDGISQPKPRTSQDPSRPKQSDEVALGEVVLGYANDRDDSAPARFASSERWRARNRKKALALQHNGTFLVVRKLEQDVKVFNAFIDAEVVRINSEHKLMLAMTADRLKAKMLGRWPDGKPLIPTTAGSLNNFDYSGDQQGNSCPFASHVRRTNPRDSFQGRPAPRIMRRGMLFGDMTATEAPRGLMFMAYNASIAEQFETIQRWINGGNSTGIHSGHNDPLLGVAPKSSLANPADRVFRFVEGDQVIRLSMPDAFVKLHWGQYFFVPSKSAIKALCGLKGRYRVLDEARETKGNAFIQRMHYIDNQKEQGREWKRVLEDFDVKDPAEKDISPDVWSAIRWHCHGALRISGIPDAMFPPVHNWNEAPDVDKQEIILCAGYKQVMGVLKNWQDFTTEEQLRRITPNSGPIYVAQQPDNKYNKDTLKNQFNYRLESEKTNAILMSFDRTWGFESGYKAGAGTIARAKALAAKGERDYFKLELRRQFILPALAAMCNQWYGLPDNEHMFEGGWQWEPPAARTPPGPRGIGDFLSPSRNAFYPRPTPTVAQFAQLHGAAILSGCEAFVETHTSANTGDQTGVISAAMFAATPNKKVLARNIAGTMVGAIPPMDGNLRGILAEWFGERTLWRHQANLRNALNDRPATADVTAAMDVLYGPVSQAMCKRPAPDLLYRTALKDTEISLGKGRPPLKVKERDLVIVSLVSAAQRSLESDPDQGDVSIVFGGKRKKAYQPSSAKSNETVHACPAQELAMGAMMGILAALLDAGRLQIMPASLIVRINQWT